MKESKMQHKEKIIPALVIGSAAAIATAIYLQTDEGRKMLAKLESIASRLLSDLAQEWSDENIQIAEKFLRDDLKIISE